MDQREGSSARQVKRRRARLRRAGIDPTTLPTDYVKAPSLQRAQMVADSEVSLEVGAADTTPLARRTAAVLRLLRDGSHDNLEPAQLTTLARVPVLREEHLAGLAQVLIDRGHLGTPLAAICEHDRCPTAVLHLALERGQPGAVLAAVKRLAALGEPFSVDTARLSLRQRLALANQSPGSSLLPRLLTDPAMEVRRALAKHPLDVTASMVLATDSESCVRLALADHTVHHEALEWLRHDVEDSVRTAALRRAQTLEDSTTTPRV